MSYPAEKYRLVVVSMAINQPRVQRRILFLESAGFDVCVYAFDRRIYGKSDFFSKFNGEVYLLGCMTGGGGLSNYLSLLMGLFKVAYAEILKNKKVIYFFGFPPILINFLLGNAKRIYEVGDLRFTSLDESLKKLAQLKIENKFLKNVDVLVLTSPGFLDEFNSRIQLPAYRTLIIENGIPEELLNQWVRPQKEFMEYGPVIRIGFIGFLRYLPVLAEFVKAVGNRSKSFEMHIYGDGYDLQPFIKLCDRYDNVHFYGKFRNPEDVQRLYSGIDISLAVYDNGDRNVQLALPNKLYESIYFGVPLIVSSGTCLSERVGKWGVGFDVDPQDAGFVDRFLDSLDLMELRHKALACLNVPIDHLQARMEGLEDFLLDERV